jgi:hypothetical protein
MQYRPPFFGAGRSQARSDRRMPPPQLREHVLQLFSHKKSNFFTLKKDYSVQLEKHLLFIHLPYGAYAETTHNLIGQHFCKFRLLAVASCHLNWLNTAVTNYQTYPT